MGTGRMPSNVSTNSAGGVISVPPGTHDCEPSEIDLAEYDSINNNFGIRGQEWERASSISVLVPVTASRSRIRTVAISSTSRLPAWGFRDNERVYSSVSVETTTPTPTTVVRWHSEPITGHRTRRRPVGSTTYSIRATSVYTTHPGYRARTQTVPVRGHPRLDEQPTGTIAGPRGILTGERRRGVAQRRSLRGRRSYLRGGL